MPNRKLAGFVVKRALVCYILLSIIGAALMEQRWYILAGMLLGMVVNLIRFASYGFVFERIFLANRIAVRKVFSVLSSLAIFIINQMVLLPLLFIAYKFNLYFFIGVFIGIMILPFVLFVNCLTEALGITHNNFE